MAFAGRLRCFLDLALLTIVVSSAALVVPASAALADVNDQALNPCTDKLETIEADSPCLVGQGNFIGNVFYEDDSSADGHQVTYPNLALRYGPAQNIELQADLPSYVDSDGLTGVTDASFGIKFGFGGGPSRAAIAVLHTWQSGTRSLSDGPATIVTGSFAYALNDTVNFVPGFSAGWSRPLSDSGTRTNEFTSQPSLSVEVDLPLKSEAELQLTQTTLRGAENISQLGFALDLRHFISKTSALSLILGRNVEETNTKSLSLGGAIFF